jgi:hypothetical protein
LAYKDPVLVPTDVSTAVHSPRYEASWISELDRRSWKHDGAALIEARGCFVLQSLMRALMVEHVPEAIEPSFVAV